MTRCCELIGVTPRNEYQHAITVMPQDETIFSKWDIIEAKINATFAKERIDFLSNKGRVQKRIARADQQILAIEKNRARAEISIAQQILDALELKAPKGGLVIYRRDRMREPQVGRRVLAGSDIGGGRGSARPPGANLRSGAGCGGAGSRTSRWQFTSTRFPGRPSMARYNRWLRWRRISNATRRSNISPARLPSRTPTKT